MIETTPCPPPTSPTVSARAPRAGRFGRELGYLLSGLPVGIAAFVLGVAGFATGVATFAVWLGVPVLAGTLAAARGLARVERRRVETVTGRELPPHHYRQTPGARPTAWFRTLADPQPWRDLVHLAVSFPLRVTSFCVAVVWTVGGAGELCYVLWFWAIPYGTGRDKTGLLDVAFGVSSRALDIAFHTGIGILLLATCIPVSRALVAVNAALARGLLTNQTAALRARAERLESGRRSAVAAEAQTLRRLERDIHDGPQQRLMRLNMDLETVARRLEDDPQRARGLVAEMLTQSSEALTELRALSRGIAPPILSDRGLSAALTAAAARSPVPVSLDIGLPEGQRFAPVVENTAYFVATEALANVAKHAQASEATVTVHTTEQTLSVQVHDDGRGGAHAGKGHGLSGLADRLTTVDGTLEVTSPPGGPTVLTAEIPLAGLGEP
jgi:signal transduction histidine kinase